MKRNITTILILLFFFVFVFVSESFAQESFENRAQIYELPLNDEKKLNIGLCFLKNTQSKQQIDNGLEWIKSLFLYGGGMKCFADSVNYNRKEFYDLSSLEIVSEVKIDQRHGSTIISKDKYTWGNQLYISSDFVKWLYYNFAVVDIDSKLFEVYVKVYNQNKYFVRTFYFSLQYLVKFKNYKLEVEKYRKAVEVNTEMLSYLKQFKPDDMQNYDKEIYEYKTESSHSGYKDGINRFRFGTGFWLRRAIDGTSDLFRDCLIRILETYDASWYNKQKGFTFSEPKGKG